MVGAETYDAKIGGTFMNSHLKWSEFILDTMAPKVIMQEQMFLLTSPRGVLPLPPQVKN